MTELNLSSGITYREEPPKTRLLQGVPTSILAALGVTERGPHVPTLVTSFEEYLNTFGGDIADSDLPNAIRAFFDEGGRQAWIQRVVHYTTISNPLTRQGAKGTITLQSAVASPGQAAVNGSIAGPWALTPGDDLDITTDLGGPTVATFNADAATVTGSNTAPFALANNDTLIVEIDNGAPQTITFLTSEFADIGNATAEEVAAVINAKISGAFADVTGNAVRITSDLIGTDSDVTVTGGVNGPTVLGLVGATDAGGGNVADISAVTAAEAKTIIEAAVAGVTVTEETGGELTITRDTPGVGFTVQVEATSTADDEFGFDNAVHEGDSGAAVDTLVVNGKTEGSYTDDIQVRVEAASSGDPTEFNMKIEDDGNVAEVYGNVSMASGAERNVIDVVNAESNLVELEHPVTPVYLRPADGLSAALAGGDDGLGSLDNNDYIGSAAGKTGLRAFDEVPDVSLLIVPGITTSAVQLAALTYAEDTREGSMFCFLDPPEGLTASEMVTFAETTNQLYGRSEYGAIHWPRVDVVNPDTGVFGESDTITIPPSGHLAGLCARNDGERPGGVYDAPAGVEKGAFRTVMGLESEETKDKAKRDLLYPKRINPIRVLGAQIIADGVRNLLGTGNFPSIQERRGVIFIERSLQAGLEFARFRNNDRELRAEVRRAIDLFLVQQMKRGAFRTKNKETAFNIDVSDELNTEAVVLSGRLLVKIGLATAKAAEFINMVFTQDTRTLDEQLAQGQA
jgi:phage tail sheath protein FI